jgi:hypothetical protein
MKKVLILNYHKLTEANRDCRNQQISRSILVFHQTTRVDQIKNQNEHHSSPSTMETYPISRSHIRLLKEHGIKGMFFPVINTIGTKDHLTWEQLIEISNERI